MNQRHRLSLTSLNWREETPLLQRMEDLARREKEYDNIPAGVVLSQLGMQHRSPIEEVMHFSQVPCF